MGLKQQSNVLGFINILKMKQVIVISKGRNSKERHKAVRERGDHGSYHKQKVKIEKSED